MIKSVGAFVSDTLTDAEIVRGLRQGDRRAWERLCKQYSPRVWRYVARLVGQNEEVVAEVFQETMLAVAKSGRNLENDSRLWPWLAAISHNQTALYWRKNARIRRLDVKSVPSDSTLPPTPLELLLQAEKVQLVRTLLAEMNADAVTLLSAKYLDGLSITEIVELMGGTQESVRSRLARARRDFRARFERVCQESDQPALPTVEERTPPEGKYA
ncbi:MAG: sigma-70 family RNA polymerase sigma factor [Planctomycetaceae bacterium]|nr:sigma-70 family RNA polymerase sigma factor [Planctomycetaceae bacterium]